MKTYRILAATVLLSATAALAQPASPATAPDTPAQPATRTTTSAVQATEGGETSEQLRREFNRLLELYPPEVGKVLKLDPTLLSSAGYLATYPELAQFIAAHPEVAHSPRYYLESVSGFAEVPAETAGMRLLRSIFDGISVFVVLVFVAFVISWLIRMVIDHRRWSRLSRVQSEVHNKLLDRFTTNEELFAYIQTPAGRRFLESAPIQLDAAPRQLAAPVSRILWSVQAGLVLAAAGVGFQIVSARVAADISEPMFAIGIIAIAVGLGFVLSAAVSFFLSRRLGLFESATAAGAE